MIQWFRLLFYFKLFKKGPEEMPTEEEYIDQAAIMRSEAIDRQLEADATYLRRETKLVLMGQVNSGKELIMRQMKVLYAEGYPQEERIQYRYAIRSTIRLLVHSIIDLLRDTGINLSEDLIQISYINLTRHDPQWKRNRTEPTYFEKKRRGSRTNT